MTKRVYPAETRSRVVAEIMAGEAIAKVAKRYDLPYQTAQGWWAEDRPAELTQMRTRERMVEELYDASAECFRGVRATARLLQDENWTRTQTAGELATLVAAVGDRGLRMLGGLRPASPEPPGITDGTVIDGEATG